MDKTLRKHTLRKNTLRKNTRRVNKKNTLRKNTRRVNKKNTLRKNAGRVNRKNTRKKYTYKKTIKGGSTIGQRSSKGLKSLCRTKLNIEYSDALPDVPAMYNNPDTLIQLHILLQNSNLLKIKGRPPRLSPRLRRYETDEGITLNEIYFILNNLYIYSEGAVRSLRHIQIMRIMNTINLIGNYISLNLQEFINSLETRAKYLHDLDEAGEADEGAVALGKIGKMEPNNDLNRVIQAESDEREESSEREEQGTAESSTIPIPLPQPPPRVRDVRAEGDEDEGERGDELEKDEKDEDEVEAEANADELEGEDDSDDEYGAESDDELGGVAVVQEFTGLDDVDQFVLNEVDCSERYKDTCMAPCNWDKNTRTCYWSSQ